MTTTSYVDQVFETVKKRNIGEPEFLQAVTEVLRSINAGAGPASGVRGIAPAGEASGTGTRRHVSHSLAERPGIGSGKPRIPHSISSAIGPYKGGNPIPPDRLLGILKFLAFEQSSRTRSQRCPWRRQGRVGLRPQRKSDAEVMRFCQSFMTELCRHISSTQTYRR